MVLFRRGDDVVGRTQRLQTPLEAQTNVSSAPKTHSAKVSNYQYKKRGVVSRGSEKHSKRGKRDIVAPDTAKELPPSPPSGHILSLANHSAEPTSQQLSPSATPRSQLLPWSAYVRPNIYMRSDPRHWSESSTSKPYDFSSPLTASSTCFTPHSVSTPHLPSPSAELPFNRGQETQDHLAGEASAVFDDMADKMTAVLESIDDYGDELGDGYGTGSLQDSEIAAASHTQRYRPGAIPTHLIKASQKRDQSFKPGKVWHYSNSRLPVQLPSLQIYTPTHPILCLAARHCYLSYYQAPLSKTHEQKHILIPASIRAGTKAMLMSVVPVDDKQNIVLAVRGTAGIFDWMANFDITPDSPYGFLDDAGNLVHSGFLAAAKAMIAPVTESLRKLIVENPARQTFSLIITGHSAGGAVASLLFCHMLSQSSTVVSDLKYLANFLRRIHCITFGTPPISTSPLQKPSGAASSRWKKSLFFAFINEGDPVARITPAGFKNLINLQLRPVPEAKLSGSDRARRPTWKVPPINFCNAGRIVLLRRRREIEPSSSSSRVSSTSRSSKPVIAPLKNKVKVNGARAGFFARLKANGNISSRAQTSTNTTDARTIEAVEVTDEQLRGHVFGDPKMHPIGLYEERIKTLAVKAVTAGLYDFPTT